MRATLAGMTVATGLGLMALGLAPGAAQAAQILNFSGACTDCTGVGTGVLTLTDNAGGALTKADFLGFAYSSNMVSFSISAADVVAVTGSMDPNNLGNTYIDVLQLGGTGWEFTRNKDGSWSVSSDLTQGNTDKGYGGSAGRSDWSSADIPSGDPQRMTDDYGDDSDFVLDSINPQSTAVPEPASWALMVLGLGGLGAGLRGRRRNAPLAGLGAIETA